MEQRFRQDVFFVAEDEVHLFADIHLPPGQYSGTVSTAFSGHPNHRYELHLSREQLLENGWFNGSTDTSGRSYNVTALVEAGRLIVW